MVIAKDLTLPSAASEIYQVVKQAGVEVDYLINNAGFGGRGKFYERPWEQDLAMIDLNVVALTALARLFLPDFVERNEGKILNVSSTASLMAGPLQLEVVSGVTFTQRMMMAAIPITPKKMLLRQVRQMQEV